MPPGCVCRSPPPKADRVWANPGPLVRPRREVRLRKPLLEISGTLAVLLNVLVGCAVNPVTGKQEVMLVSESQELALGSPSQFQMADPTGKALNE